VDIETRRKKQRKLMAQLVERKVRSRAKQLYETRGQVEGHALQDWVQAETEVRGRSIMARGLRSESLGASEMASPTDVNVTDSSTCGTSA
jgi:hypothetical protein